MVRPSLRSRSSRRVKRKVPGGRVVLHYKTRKVGKQRCGGCGANLLGVAHGIASKVRIVSLSQKRPSRPYGGMLCSSCARAIHIRKARSL